ncbi:MAG: DUF2202 domain-containing protein [Lewinellaceae bacterium]|nr:DUF2202 domain-containing protein [Lewinellaceae bacterium]
MKNQMVRWIGSVALLFGFAVLFTQCEKTEPGAPAMEDGIAVGDRGVVANPGDVCSCLAAAYGPQELSTAESEALAFMREEEKLARDVYLGLYELWDYKVFSNIARSEQRHMDAVLCLIERYGLADPAEGKGIGEFEDSHLGGLYATLMAQGRESLEAALKVGAAIEDLDISDLQENIGNPDVDNDDVLAVFNNLTKGSRNHLRAFTRSLATLGAAYEVQHLSQEEYEAIITTERERGESLCGACTGNGAGLGNGQGTGTCDGTGPHGSGTGNGTPNGAGICPNNTDGGAGTGTCDGTGPHGNQTGNGNGNGSNGTGNNGNNGNSNGNNGNGNGGN